MDAPKQSSTMFLVLPVPFRSSETGLMVEHQAHHGMRRWLDSFERLTIAAPLLPDAVAREHPELHWLATTELAERIEFLALPWTHRPDKFLRQIPGTARQLDSSIDKARYLQFALGGIWGDWAAVAALRAIAKGRTFAVHTDRVEHEVLLRVAADRSPLKRLRARLDSRLMQSLHKYIIKRAALGLFHGMDTYKTYQAWMAESARAERGFCIHNIHDEGLTYEDEPSPAEADIGFATTGVRLFYAGRIEATKAPLQWLETIELLKQQKPLFSALWAGEGDMRAEFEQKARELQLGNTLTIPGYIGDRKTISRLYRSADIFLFTHITPESPRCLIEALRFGVPIVGYESEYARDLIKDNGGGVLVPVGDRAALANAVAAVVNEPGRLAELKQRALRDGGARFSSKAVFEERSRLIKTYT